MSEPSPSERIRGLRILAVDDEPDVLETIVDVLDGAKVDCAKSYQQALDLLMGPSDSGAPAQERYDLAVLDIMGVDGMSLLSQTVNLKIPTVMLTAHAMNPQTMKASILNGALSYLPKEELANLDQHIVDVFEAVEQGQSTWQRMFNRLGRFFERAYGPSWQSDDPEFWRYYYVPMV